MEIDDRAAEMIRQWALARGGFSEVRGRPSMEMVLAFMRETGGEYTSPENVWVSPEKFKRIELPPEGDTRKRLNQRQAERLKRGMSTVEAVVSPSGMSTLGRSQPGRDSVPTRGNSARSEITVLPTDTQPEVLGVSKNIDARDETKAQAAPVEFTTREVMPPAPKSDDSRARTMDLTVVFRPPQK